jgi:hypothetical protein
MPSWRATAISCRPEPCSSPPRIVMLLSRCRASCAGSSQCGEGFSATSRTNGAEALAEYMRTRAGPDIRPDIVMSVARPWCPPSMLTSPSPSAGHRRGTRPAGPRTGSDLTVYGVRTWLTATSCRCGLNSNRTDVLGLFWRKKWGLCRSNRLSSSVARGPGPAPQ